MAGAGYKLFNTGDVLTAAQVNTYLMEQTVMVFADSTARTTALSGVVAEGMLSYLKSTKQVEVYNGTSWVASDDPNAIQNTIVDAKGDLITATAADVPARLAVGSNGDYLLADSSTSTGLRWQGDYAAGKNKIINGDFSIWQRGTSFTNPTLGTYTADRWKQGGRNAEPTSSSLTRETFTPGTAPVAGYEGAYFARSTITTVGSTTSYAPFTQLIEDVRTFAGQTVTISFWAKSDSNRTGLVFMTQEFGSGGSAAVTTSTSNLVTTTSWSRFTFTVAVPSISGKTIGTNSNLTLAIRQAAASGSVLDIWGVQVEAGSVATAFQTATGNFGNELAAAQRYYYRNSPVAASVALAVGMANLTTEARGVIKFPTTMRARPTALEQSGTASDYSVQSSGSTNTTCSAVPVFFTATQEEACVNFTVASGLTAGDGVLLRTATTAAYLGWSAEL
jgi:hypothetical protein